MAHRLVGVDLPEKEPKKKFKLKLPHIEGRVGVSLYLGNREYFLGLSITEVIKEQVVRKRTVKIPKGVVHVMPLSE